MTREEYERNPQRCQECGQPIPMKSGDRPSLMQEKKYCDRSRAARHNNRAHPKRRLQGQCKTCGSATPASRTYCSQSCQRQAIASRRPEPEETRGKHVRSVVGWRQRVKLRALAYKGGKRQLCGYDRCIQAMQFHHLDPARKAFTISGKTLAWDRIQAEIEKCVLLCANCHAEVHAGIVDPYLPR